MPWPRQSFQLCERQRTAGFLARGVRGPQHGGYIKLISEFEGDDDDIHPLPLSYRCYVRRIMGGLRYTILPSRRKILRSSKRSNYGF